MRRLALPLSLALVLTMSAPTSAATDVAVHRIAGEDRVATAIAISQRHDTATVAVVAASDRAADALAGVPLAAHLDAPLLLTEPSGLDPRVGRELDRLGVTRVVLLGGYGALSRAVEDGLASYDVDRVAGPDRTATSIAVARRLPPASRAYVVAADRFADALAVGPIAAREGAPVLLLTRGRPAPIRTYLDETGIATVVAVGGAGVISDDDLSELGDDQRTVRRLAGDDRYATAAKLADRAVATGADPSTVWLVDGRGFPDGLAAGPAVGDHVLLLVDGSSPWSTDPAAVRLRGWQPRGVVLVGGHGAITSSAAAQVQNVVGGPELPRGGHALYPRHRLVAFYGHHSTDALGVLGEQPADRTYDRLWRQAAPYEAGGRSLLPVFEVIASLATSGPGPDGDYSAPSSREDLLPWLEAARRDGVYLLLDLQSGRTDFLTEAKRYEWLLKEPDVGLALDPEWRMGPDGVPGQSVGSVHASEVNEVSAWLAGLVRRHRLPQKLLVVHQFQLRMIQDRHLLADRDELALTIQMDGQGSRVAKLNTYAALTRDDGPWRMGFKLFYDEDPDMFAPEDVLARRPEVFFISYQ